MGIDTTNDKFLKVAQNVGWQVGSGGVPDASATTIPLVNTTNIPNDTAVIVTIDRVDANGTPTPSKMERIVGRVSGNNLVDCIRGVAGTAQAHSAGAVVEIVIDAVLWNKIVSGILKEHNADGSHPMKDWFQLTTVIPTRASADDPTYVLTFAGVDLTSAVSPGMRIKWTQNSTVRYGIVTAISYSGGNTTLTLYSGTDYDVDDTATYPISNVFFSPHKAPFGFPLDPAKWTVKVIYSGQATQSNPTQNVWYNIGNRQITVPIGKWNLSYNFGVGGSKGSASYYLIECALSETNNGKTNNDLAYFFDLSNIPYDLRLPVYKEAVVDITSKTNFYFNMMTTQSNFSSLFSGAPNTENIIQAVSAYL